MFEKIRTVIKHYEKENFSGSLKFSVSKKSDEKQIDLVVESGGKPFYKDLFIRTDHITYLKELCDKLNYGSITVYLWNGYIDLVTIKDTYIGNEFNQLVKKCEEENKCRRVFVVKKK